MLKKMLAVQTYVMILGHIKILGKKEYIASDSSSNNSKEKCLLSLMYVWACPEVQ